MTPADSLTTRAAANVVPIRRSRAARIPWLWYDYVVSRVPLPLWLPSLLLFVGLYFLDLVPAIIAGEVPQFVRDIRYLLLPPLPAFGSFAIAYIPGAMTRLWAGIRPWLANTEDQIAALEAATPELLSRFFWLGVLVMAVVTVPYAIPGGDPWARAYAHPHIIEKATLVSAPFLLYFGGALFSIASLGLGIFARHLSRAVDFKRGFILHGGKAALQPFNALLWAVWVTFTFPLILMIVVLVAADPTSTDEPLDAVQFIVIGIMALPTLVLPQLFMNRLMAREKARELLALSQELQEAATPPEEHDTFEVLQRMQRHQHLLHEIQEAKAFTPRWWIHASSSRSGPALAPSSWQTSCSGRCWLGSCHKERHAVFQHIDRTPASGQPLASRAHPVALVRLRRLARAATALGAVFASFRSPLWHRRHPCGH